MNEIEKSFSAWLKQTTSLSDNSIYKYTKSIISISNDMLDLGVISKSLINMNKIELDSTILIILNNPDFIKKDNRGNHMYSCGLKHFRSYKAMLGEEEIDYKSLIDDIKKDNSISITEKNSLIKSRVGQGKFREALLKKYNETCIITGINIKTLLVASHIKPWAVSSNTERLSPENGLLLSATYDRLFDSGLISFDNSGIVLISKYIDNFNRLKLHLDNKISVNTDFSKETKINLEYHRDIIFLK
ncbi:MAG: HNH endonuclease [Ruminococcus sp.]|nr:HNH endonuclease [Ruminococcus sp.]